MVIDDTLRQKPQYERIKLQLLRLRHDEDAVDAVLKLEYYIGQLAEEASAQSAESLAFAILQSLLPELYRVARTWPNKVGRNRLREILEAALQTVRVAFSLSNLCLQRLMCLGSWQCGAAGVDLDVPEPMSVSSFIDDSVFPSIDSEDPAVRLLMKDLRSLGSFLDWLLIHLFAFLRFMTSC